MVCEAVSHFYRFLSELSEITFDPKAAQLPDVPLEEYRICMFQQWRPGEIAFTVVSLLYGVFCPSIPPSCGINQPLSIEDCAAFLVIAFSARKWGRAHAAGVPSLLRNILEGATIYFLVVFAGQLLFIFFQLLAPVSDCWNSRGKRDCDSNGREPQAATIRRGEVPTVATLYILYAR